MKTIYLLLLGLFSVTGTIGQNPKSDNMEQEVKAVITSFQEAIAKRNVESLDQLLNKDFRVMANQFKGMDGTLLLSKEAYLKMMSEGKIGGTMYAVEFHEVLVTGHTAAVDVTFASNEEASMHLYLLLVQDTKGHWTLISDLPLMMGGS